MNANRQSSLVWISSPMDGQPPACRTFSLRKLPANRAQNHPQTRLQTTLTKNPTNPPNPTSVISHFRNLLCASLTIFVSIFGTPSAATAAELQTLTLEPAPRMDRAVLRFIKTVPNPRAVLILCPGFNGDGAGLVEERVWQDYARRENLGLVGLSFASPIEALHDGTGYYYVSKGSGALLLKGIREIYGKDLPLLLYGFSGGAHFTSRFTEWCPQRVRTWCAYSAGWWDEPARAERCPPGIVACGDVDARYGASLIYFKQGRAAGKPWLWVSLPGTDHVYSPNLDAFVRDYFSTILSEPQHDAFIVDIDQKAATTAAEAQTHPSLTAWMPSPRIYASWKEIHEP